jgi:hypothetical protein
VNTGSQASQGLGIASLVVAIVALFICWMPLIGVGLSLLSMGLGVGGLYLAITRKGSGLGYAIAGCAIGGVGFLLGGLWTLSLIGAASAARSSVRSFARPGAHDIRRVNADIRKSNEEFEKSMRETEKRWLDDIRSLDN